jgi:hypothetical protein
MCHIQVRDVSTRQNFSRLSSSFQVSSRSIKFIKYMKRKSAKSKKSIISKKLLLLHKLQVLGVVHTSNSHFSHIPKNGEKKSVQSIERSRLE